jgi:ribosomal protein S12 methylthiotransferase
MVSLGCPKNLVDTEIMLGILDKDEYDITGDEKQADIIIVNTCGFIESAKQESIDTILEMAAYKKDKCKLLIVTGCLAERYSDDIVQEIPEVVAVLGVGDYSEISEIVKKAFSGERKVFSGNKESISHLEKDRLVSTGKAFAYIKISEGCDNNCTYCAIPSIRGGYKSRKIENIVNEAKRIAQSGTKEIVIIAQDTTRYGLDLYGEKKLVPLLKELSKIDEIHWIRLLYCYPMK